MIIGKRDIREVTRLRFDNLQLSLRQGLMERDMEALLQYGAVIALAKVQHDDFQPILEQARGHLTAFGYETLERFAGKMAK